MNPSTLTDAAVHRMIRRILTAPSTTSDSLLALADGLDEAAAWTDRNDAAAFLADHAAALRKLAPCFADRMPRATAPAAITPLEAARLLVRNHGATTRQIADAFADTAEHSPLWAILGLLLTAAETDADAAELVASA